MLLTLEKKEINSFLNNGILIHIGSLIKIPFSAKISIREKCRIIVDGDPQYYMWRTDLENEMGIVLSNSMIDNDWFNDMEWIKYYSILEKKVKYVSSWYIKKEQVLSK